MVQPQASSLSRQGAGSLKAPPCSGASFDIRAGIALPGAYHRPPRSRAQVPFLAAQAAPSWARCSWLSHRPKCPVTVPGAPTPGSLPRWTPPCTETQFSLGQVSHKVSIVPSTLSHSGLHTVPQLATPGVLPGLLVVGTWGQSHCMWGLARTWAFCCRLPFDQSRVGIAGRSQVRGRASASYYLNSP